MRVSSCMAMRFWASRRRRFRGRRAADGAGDDIGIDGAPVPPMAMPMSRAMSASADIFVLFCMILLLHQFVHLQVHVAHLGVLARMKAVDLEP